MRFRPIRALRKAATDYSRGTSALAISGSYAAVVLGVAGFVAIATSLGPGSIAAVWLIVVALPVSLLVLLVPANGILLTLLIALGGFGQAWLLWVVLRGNRLS